MAAVCIVLTVDTLGRSRKGSIRVLVFVQVDIIAIFVSVVVLLAMIDVAGIVVVEVISGLIVLLYDQMKSGNQIYVRELPYSLDFLVENFMDPAHIPFAHHKLQSTRDDGSPIAMAEILSNFTTVETSFKDMTGKRTRDAYASFQRPSCYHYGEYKGEILLNPI